MLKEEFFSPVSDPAFDLVFSSLPDSLASVTSVYSLNNGFPDIDNAKIAILGIADYRGSVFNRKFVSGTNAIREKLYRLMKHEKAARLIDLGDLLPGNSPDDTCFALSEIVNSLLKKSIIPVVIGGSQDLTIAQFNAYKEFGKLINMAGIDSRFDLGLPDETVNSSNWLGKIVLQQPNFLFNFSNIGYQTYFVGSSSVDLMNKLYFDAYRIGEVRATITEIEPVIRTAELISFDLSAIRQSDAPGTTNPSPHGFSGEEACQIMMYAGLNDRLSGVGIYEYDFLSDRNDQTAHLLAHMIWYFIEGVTNRKNDFPQAGLDGFMVYRVPTETSDKDLVFLKNKMSGRWWMEVPATHTSKGNFIIKNNYLPCSQLDYQQACNNELPERYWLALQKI